MKESMVVAGVGDGLQGRGREAQIRKFGHEIPGLRRRTPAHRASMRCRGTALAVGERAARIADLSRGWGRYRSPSDKVKYSRYFGLLRRNKFPWSSWRSLDSSWTERGI